MYICLAAVVFSQTDVSGTPMRQLLIHTIILFLSTFEVSGQHKSNQFQIKEVKGTDDNCVYKSRYTITQRLRRYPFNKSYKVILASFRYHDKSYPIKNGEVIYDSLIEHKILSKQEVVELTDIIYNNVYKKSSGIGSITMCFFPRILQTQFSGHTGEQYKWS